MNVTPIGDRIVVELADAADKVGSLYVPDTAKEKPVIGVVKAFGQGTYNKVGVLIPIQVKKGDKILFSKYAGTEVEVEGEKIFIIRETDILGILT